MNKELISRQQVCELLKINSVTLWRRTTDGNIPYYRVGRRMLFIEDEVLAAIRVKYDSK